MTTVVEVPATLNGAPAILAMQLLGPTTRTIDENSPNAMLEYKFPDDLRKIIKESRYWGRIKSHVMFAFSSKYALALYEAVCLRANLRVDHQDFSVEDFRALLGVEKDQYPGFPQLKQRVLDAAVGEVNALSDFNVEIQPIRKGGQQRSKLTGFRLFWEKKTPEQWRAVLDELLRPKMGRKARIRGVVERVA
jgi:plasmid replication initiation protein